MIRINTKPSPIPRDLSCIEDKEIRYFDAAPLLPSPYSEADQTQMDSTVIQGSLSGNDTSLMHTIPPAKSLQGVWSVAHTSSDMS